MGFKNNTYATVWEVSPVSDSCTKVRLTTGKKNKATGSFETDFSGYVFVVGTAAASKAARLNVKDRIKLGDTEVTTKYDKAAGKNYTNFKIFGFELASTDSNQSGGGSSGGSRATPAQQTADSSTSQALPF